MQCSSNHNNYPYSYGGPSSYQEISEVPRIISNKSKGNKISMHQIRQKQFLKNQVLLNHGHMKTYINNEKYEEFVVSDQVTNSWGFGIEESGLEQGRPRTGRILTSDSGMRSKIRRLDEDLMSRNRTMMVTSHGSQNNKNEANVYFTSSNLDKKTNRFMNLFLRNEHRSPLPNAPQIPEYTSLPKKLSNFERKMRKANKSKSAHDEIESPRLFSNVNPNSSGEGNGDKSRNKSARWIEFGKISENLESRNPNFSTLPIGSGNEYKTLFVPRSCYGERKYTSK